MTKPVIKLPDSKGGWASLGLGVCLMGVGIFHLILGENDQAWLDFTGAFGTLGLPSIFGAGYHVEIKKDVPIDTTAPEGFGGTGRLTETNEEIDAEPLGPRKPKPGPVTEVRRADEL